jgi:flagellin-like hook-associated protein FlgL
MSDVVLSGGVRSNLLNLQTTENLIAQTQVRLATGKRVNSALDNPTNFFTAQTLNNRAGDLSTLLDSMSNAVKTLQAADNGITAITKLVQSAQALARQAQQTSDPAEKATLATQFDDTLAQIDALAGDASFNGKNLIAGTGAANDLSVVFNEDGSSTLTIAAVDLTTAAAGIDIPGAVGSWASAASIQTSLDKVTAALAELRSQAKAFGSSLATVEARQDFTKALINTLSTGADNLTLADSNEEGANLLALQTRQQLSTTALSLAVQSDRNVLRLFGG